MTLRSLINAAILIHYCITIKTTEFVRILKNFDDINNDKNNYLRYIYVTKQDITIAILLTIDNSRIQVSDFIFNCSLM